MTRFLALVIAFTVFTVPAMAADEFGDRFSTQEPAALSDPMQANEQATAEAMQNIEPAAGDVVQDGVDPEALADEEAAVQETPSGPGVVAKEDLTEY